VKQVLQNNNYRIDLGHRDGIYHINSLRKFLGEETQNNRPIMTVLTTDDTEHADWFVQMPDTEAIAKITRRNTRTNEENRCSPDADGVMTPAGRERISEQKENRRAHDEVTVNKKPRHGMVTSTDTDFVIGGT